MKIFTGKVSGEQIAKIDLFQDFVGDLEFVIYGIYNIYRPVYKMCFDRITVRRIQSYKSFRTPEEYLRCRKELLIYF